MNVNVGGKTFLGYDSPLIWCTFIDQSGKFDERSTYK